MLSVGISFNLALEILVFNSNPKSRIVQLKFIQINKTKKLPREPYSLLYWAKYSTNQAKPKDPRIKNTVAKLAPAENTFHRLLEKSPTLYNTVTEV